MFRPTRIWAAVALAGAACALGLAPACCTPKEEGLAVTASPASEKANHPPAGQAGRATQGDGGEATTAVATFAAGCFWGVEARFRAVPGVLDTMVGYTGGHTENPTYEEVCSHTTGHAEAVQVTFDPGKVTFEALLAIFWNLHDPTTRNRQGPDVGSQYRSAIFTHTPEQKRAAEASKRRLAESGKHGAKPIVTEITPATTFWRAEEYHQRYLEKRGQGACPTG